MKKGLYWLGKHRSEETCKKLSGLNKEKHLSEETKQKIRLANKGKHLSRESIKKSSEARRGVLRSEETRLKMREAAKNRQKEQYIKSAVLRKGKHLSEAHRRKISEALMGERNKNWKGGATNINIKIRQSLEYRLWREAVFRRDNFVCVWCGKKGGKLNADHIKRFSDYPELRFAIDNGRTLCILCHKTTDTYGRK